MSARRFVAVGGALVALAVAGCGSSPEDTAHDNGKAVGEALHSLSQAKSADDVTSAVAQLKDAVGNVTSDVKDSVRRQVSVQRDSLNQVVGDVRKAAAASDTAATDQARTALQQDLQDLRAQASSFGGTRNSVTNSFWDGVKQGYDGS